MYHNRKNVIEVHDDVKGVYSSKVELKKNAPALLHVTYVLRPDREYEMADEASCYLHSTNGVDHRLALMHGEGDALMSDPANVYQGDVPEDAAPAESKKKGK